MLLSLSVPSYYAHIYIYQASINVLINIDFVFIRNVTS